ncbi:MAG: ABC transporter permease, partial [Campylobacterota bacterium]|nr:ABC transporter permease [Campylobacterota bacterium]
MQKLFYKISYLVLMLLLISLISFVAIHSAPNSFFSAGELNPNMTPEAIEQLRAVYGLNKALHVQFFDWIINIVTLNFGVSFVSGTDVSTEISKRVGITLFINITSLIAVFAISLYLGIKSALNYEKRADYIITQFNLVSFAMPSFYLALLLILVFSVNLDVLPIAGLHSIDAGDGIFYYSDMFMHLILPLSVMIFGGVGSLSIYIRSLTLEILKSDYYFFAISRGLSKRVILKHYILPNLLPPINPGSDRPNSVTIGGSR